MHHLCLLPFAILLLLGLPTKGQGVNLLSNPTFQNSDSEPVPSGWSLRGNGFASGLQGTTTKAMALSSIDPNNPTLLFQSVVTLSSVDYQFTFDAFCTDASAGQQNFTVSFGVGACTGFDRPIVDNKRRADRLAFIHTVKQSIVDYKRRADRLALLWRL
ncbi:hypothetical protein B0H10DRAFT_1950748 [Mycena sp. CBHHK59/15]|nr:hypothetical protein B0H10DRAFT_1950748 [Mycena sp. CBHHK59/15]